MYVWTTPRPANENKIIVNHRWFAAPTAAHTFFEPFLRHHARLFWADLGCTNAGLPRPTSANYVCMQQNEKMWMETMNKHSRPRKQETFTTETIHFFVRSAPEVCNYKAVERVLLIDNPFTSLQITTLGKRA